MRWLLLLPASLCAQNLTLLTESLPAAVLAQPYELQILAAGGTRCPSNHIWFRTSEGALPPGLALDAAGWLRGTPRQPGAFRFTIEARNDCGAAQRPYTLLIAPARVLLLSPDRIELECPAKSRCAAP
ncbi:MAG: Ig domain-containing protein, partial [Bryobacter sp.]|nr:Ig domain-containing protein [Bryobacter sp.]